MRYSKVIFMEPTSPGTLCPEASLAGGWDLPVTKQSPTFWSCLYFFCHPSLHPQTFAQRPVLLEAGTCQSQNKACAVLCFVLRLPPASTFSAPLHPRILAPITDEGPGSSTCHVFNFASMGHRLQQTVKLIHALKHLVKRHSCAIHFETSESTIIGDAVSSLRKSNSAFHLLNLNLKHQPRQSAWTPFALSVLAPGWMGVA